MPVNAPKTPIEQRRIGAEVRAAQWLADANAARESGNLEWAENCDSKAQYWTDRMYLLNNRAATPASRS